MEEIRIVNYGYGLVFVRDVTVTDTVFLWSNLEMKQGFARQDSVVSFATLTNYGTAILRFGIHPYVSDGAFERVIAVPFLLTSGLLIIEGPEEGGLIKPVNVPAGSYELTFAQRHLELLERPDHGRLAFDLYMERKASLPSVSRILVQDDLLDPVFPLIEHTDSQF